MVKYSKQQYPGLDIQKADVMNNIIFSPGSFTHITCFYFTIYYIEDKEHSLIIVMIGWHLVEN